MSDWPYVRSTGDACKRARTDTHTHMNDICPMMLLHVACANTSDTLAVSDNMRKSTKARSNKTALDRSRLWLSDKIQTTLVGQVILFGGNMNKIKDNQQAFLARFGVHILGDIFAVKLGRRSNAYNKMRATWYTQWVEKDANPQNTGPGSQRFSRILQNLWSSAAPRFCRTFHIIKSLLKEGSAELWGPSPAFQALQILLLFAKIPKPRTKFWPWTSARVIQGLGCTPKGSYGNTAF